MSLSRKGRIRIYYIVIKTILKKITKYDYFWLIASIFEIITLWNWNVTLDKNFIPTIVNGASSATALLIAFMGVMMTLSYSHLKLSPQDMKDRLYFTLTGCSIALGLIGTAYLSFTVSVDFSNALKMSISGLIISIGVSATFSTYLLSKLVKIS